MLRATEKIGVLLVDDREDNLVALRAVLTDPRYELISASSGAEALARLLDHDFAVILLDVQMPGMDGFETARVIKRTEKWRSIPILFVTAISKESRYVYEGYEAGAVDYIFKPFDPQVLRSKVAVFADLYTKNRQLEHQAELLRQAEERNRLLIQSARDIIAVLGPSRRLVLLNPAFEEITGYSTTDWLRRELDPLIHPDDIAEVGRVLERVAHGENRLFETRIITRYSRVLDIEVSARTLPERSGLEGVLLVMRDVSTRKAAERERQRRFQLEQSNEELERFAYACSHDLQEPLRTITTYTQLLERRHATQLDADAGRILRYITDDAKRMSVLIRDLLAYSRVTAEAELANEFDLNRLLEMTLKSLSTAIVESDAQISWDVLPQVFGIESQFGRLFQNLLANAMKFRRAEPPRIHVGVRDLGDLWEFSVADNGIGFEMSQADMIFAIFRRLHRREEYPGTGVGLSICKRIVERHGGRIRAEALPGVGATFYFTLPKEGAMSRLRPPLVAGPTRSLGEVSPL